MIVLEIAQITLETMFGMANLKEEVIKIHTNTKTWKKYFYIE